MSGWDDLPLSELGRTQALAVAREIARRAPGAVIHASPLERTRTTARLIAEASGGRVRFSAGLREIFCGEVEGMRLADVQARYPELWEANLREEEDGFRWPGGESYAELRERCLAAVRAIAAEHPGERVVVVTHAGVIAQVLGWLRGTPAGRWSCALPGNCSITAVAWKGERGSVLRFDDRDHLATLEAPRAAEQEG